MEDIERRAIYLTTERGREFAVLWSEALLDWLEKIAVESAQLGTERPSQKTFRTFAYT